MRGNTFQSLLQRFFLERLMSQRNASPATISSYRDTFRLFLTFMKEVKRCTAAHVTLDMLNAENVLEFLEYLETTRRNSLPTLNNRLAAVHSFMGYVSYQVPEYLATIQRVLAIPYKRTVTKNVCYLLLHEVEAILDACDVSTLAGRRDRIMVALMHNTGVRVSELLSLRRRDVTFGSTTTIRLLGKGRKERSIPLWKDTKGLLHDYIDETKCPYDAFIFNNRHGDQLTRSGVKYRLDKLVEEAKCHCPSLRTKTVTPYVLRHTTAMQLLEAGVDISTIAIWLGHESIQTTHKYMVADIRLKEKALAQMVEPETSRVKYKPTADILSFLDRL